MTKLMLKIGGAIEIFNINDLKYIEAASNYSTFHFLDRKVVVSKSLGSFEYLKSIGLVRVHRSYIANINLATKITSAFISIHKDEIPYTGTQSEIVNKICENINFLKCDIS